jgi:hypothetical protein
VLPPCLSRAHARAHAERTAAEALRLREGGGGGLGATLEEAFTAEQISAAQAVLGGDLDALYEARELMGLEVHDGGFGALAGQCHAQGCLSVGGDMLVCPCRRAAYCSHECSERHWRAGHGAECLCGLPGALAKRLGVGLEGGAGDAEEVEGAEAASLD